MGKAGALWPVRARPENDDRGEPKKSRSKDATDEVLWVEVLWQVPRRPRLRSSVAVLGRRWWSSERSGGARVLDRQDTGKVASFFAASCTWRTHLLLEKQGGWPADFVRFSCSFRVGNPVRCPAQAQCAARSGKSPTCRRCGRPRGPARAPAQCSRRAHTEQPLLEWRGRATRPGRVGEVPGIPQQGAPFRTVPIVPRSAT